MTRKDYVLLAAALKNARPWNYVANDKAPASVAWLACVYGISGNLTGENPRFDCERFHRACGVFA